ncbi:MAG: glycosyltransferase family 61 protein [Spirochaetaceae bacterium]|nr:glycosyltransferase family 61 protein [Spirochaetaceae bacterium]
MSRFFARAFFKLFPFLRTVIKPVSINEVGGLTKIKVADSEIFSLNKKEDVYGKFYDDFNQDAYTAVIPDLYVYSLSKGIVKNGREEIFTHQKKVIQEITAQNENPQIGQIFPCNPIKRIHGSVAYFNLSSLEDCYGHYWCEYIGLIYLLWKSKIKPDYYIFTQKLPFQKQFIPIICNIFDIPKDKILDFPTGTIIKPDMLIFTSLLNSGKLITCGKKTGFNKIYMTHFIKDVYKMLSDSVPADNEYGERLYISRENWSFRKTANEKEVQELVSKYGFVTIHPENFDV